MNQYNTTTEIMQVHNKFLLVDPAYQRLIDERRVRAIAKDYNPLIANPVKVSKRSDGTYYVFDGQHTLAALREKFGEDVKVPCKIYEFYDVNDDVRREIEAELFSEQNGVSRSVGANDKFRALLAANDEDIKKFHKITNDSGVRMDFSKGSAKNKIVCSSQAYKAYKKLMPAGYASMLSMIKEAWGGEADSFRAEIIGGMALFMESYNGKYSKRIFTRQLRKVSPLQIIRNGKLSNEAGSRKYMVQIVNAYNNGLRTNRL